MDHEQIQRLAYELWEQRGRPIGSPDEDWLRAEELLRSQGSPSGDPLYEFRMAASADD